MTKQELFVKHHWKQSIILGVVAITMVALQVGSEEFVLHKKENKAGQILGVSQYKNINDSKNITRNEKKTKNIINYQNNIKRIITNYLKQRAKFTKPHQNWLLLINKIKQQIITLNTPLIYRDLQLKIILLLDTEKKTLINYQPQKLEQINNQWNNLLEQFWWLK